MNRQKLINKAYQRGNLLNLNTNFYKNWINKFIVDETKGDIGSGDITSNAVLRGGKKVKAIVYSRSEGVIAGIEEVSLLLKNFKIKVKKLKKDGSKLKKGSKILLLEGAEKNILKLERSVLDLLSRMSGIASITHDLVKKTKNKVKISPTRKTQWRYLDKKAVFVGGGLTHRLALWESILIKDNHLKAIEKESPKNIIETAIKRAFQHRKKANFIEIEVTNEKQAINAAELFKSLNKKDYPCIIMLDNIKPKKIKQIIRKLKKKGLYNHILIESSGGITPDNIGSYTSSGADVLSLGYLTKSSKALDIKLKIT